MLKRLVSKTQPGHALVIGAILIVLGTAVGGLIGLFGVGFARGAQIGFCAARIVGLLALTIGALVRAHTTHEGDHE